MYDLGIMYQNVMYRAGFTPKRLSIAGAGQGFALAQYKLGVMYAGGQVSSRIRRSG
jgi:hypothetical protein